MGWKCTWNRRLGEQGFGGGVGRRCGWDAQDPSEKLAVQWSSVKVWLLGEGFKGLAFFLAMTCKALVPNQVLNLCPLQWKHGILTTGLPGKSQDFLSSVERPERLKAEGGWRKKRNL